MIPHSSLTLALLGRSWSKSALSSLRFDVSDEIDDDMSASSNNNKFRTGNRPPKPNEKGKKKETSVKFFVSPFSTTRGGAANKQQSHDLTTMPGGRRHISQSRNLSPSRFHSFGRRFSNKQNYLQGFRQVPQQQPPCRCAFTGVRR